MARILENLKTIMKPVDATQAHAQVLTQVYSRGCINAKSIYLPSGLWRTDFYIKYKTGFMQECVSEWINKHPTFSIIKATCYHKASGQMLTIQTNLVK